MRDEYDIKSLNPRKNPYSSRLNTQITVNVDSGTVDFFQRMASDTGIPCQTLISLYLADCAKNNRKPLVTWTNSSAE